MKPQDVRKETVQELESKLQDMRKKYMELRFQHASGTLKNPIELRYLRKDIARTLTIVKEKLGEETEQNNVQ